MLQPGRPIRILRIAIVQAELLFAAMWRGRHSDHATRDQPMPLQACSPTRPPAFISAGSRGGLHGRLVNLRIRLEGAVVPHELAQQ